VYEDLALLTFYRFTQCTNLPQAALFDDYFSSAPWNNYRHFSRFWDQLYCPFRLGLGTEVRFFVPISYLIQLENLQFCRPLVLVFQQLQIICWMSESCPANKLWVSVGSRDTNKKEHICTLSARTKKERDTPFENRMVETQSKPIRTCLLSEILHPSLTQ